MHNEGSHNGSGWSLNTITSDLSHLLEASTSQDIFSILTPQRSVNSLASSSTALSSSLPTQYSLLPQISYNQLLRDLSHKFSHQGSSSSSVATAPPFNPLLLPNDFSHSILHSTMNHNLSSQAALSHSSTQFDTQSVHSAVNRAKKRSITEMRRTSLPPHSIADGLSSHVQMDIPSTSTSQRVPSPMEDGPSKEDEEMDKELTSAVRKAAHEEFRRRPAPIVADSYPRAPTPEDFGTLSENTYIPSHFFKGTKILLPNGDKKTVENLITDDFIMCATSSSDLVMQTSTVDFIEKNRIVYRITFAVGHNKENLNMEVSPEQPFFVIGQGWSSCAPEKTLQTFGLKVRELQQGDVCISLTTCEFQSEETRRTLDAVVGPREAAQEAAMEARAFNLYQKAIHGLPKKSRKKRQKDRRRRREGRMSEPPPELPSPKKIRRRKRCASVDPHLETSLPPLPSLLHTPSKPFSPKNNKDYPAVIGFDFEI